MKKIKLFSIFLLIFQFGISQESPFFKTYHWAESPNFNIIDYNNESIVALKHAIVTEFFYDDKNSLIEYFLEHRVLWLNSDEEIEEHNKVYIPYSESSKIEVNKARVITKKGEIIELEDSKILTSKDEETGQQYKYFAFEGIERGSIIEYFYVIKRYPKYTGNRITLQTSFRKENTSFDLFAPKNLEFEFKVYNGLTETQKDTLTKNKLHWNLKVPKLKALDDETYSAYNASKGYLIYKLGKNLVNNKSGFASYGTISQNLYAYYYPEYSKKTKKAIEEFVSLLDLKNENNEAAVLRKLENYIKSNIYISETGGEELKDLDEILMKKIANETGILKLYVALLRELNVKHELVFTSNRQELKFDKDFEAQNFLTEFLFYFPNNKTYLSPKDTDSRYGFPPAYLTDNYGLFIKEISLGNIKSGIGKINYIKAVEAQMTTDKMIIDVDFDKNDLTKNNINLERSFNGYYAMYIQPFIHLIKDDDKKKFIDQFAKNLNENVEIIKSKITNDDPELFGIKPLIVEIEFNSNAFVEKAGKKYLFKVGELIGQQIQMYQEKERVLAVESEFNRSYFRTINIKIPAGYKIVNLDDININNSYSIGDKKIVSFHSFYELNDNIVKITADEHYRENIIDVSLYEEYRKVINSAADFNKLTLVLQPIN